jgi:hypothetical protein
MGRPFCASHCAALCPSADISGSPTASSEPGYWACSHRAPFMHRSISTPSQPTEARITDLLARMTRAKDQAALYVEAGDPCAPDTARERMEQACTVVVWIGRFLFTTRRQTGPTSGGCRAACERSRVAGLRSYDVRKDDALRHEQTDFAEPNGATRQLQAEKDNLACRQFGATPS